MPRDKFAAMASRANNNNNNAEENSASTAGRENPQQDTATTTTGNPGGETRPRGAAAVSAPRRDKLAALASRNVNAAGAGGSASATPNNSRNPPPPTGRGNKFAAMSAANAGGASSTPAEEDKKESAERKRQREKEEYLTKIEQRLSKRQKILQNLDRAEDLTCKLLEIAHKTTTALQDVSSTVDISELSKSYRDTLQELHPLLSDGTQNLIQPYQNHTNETKQSMYGARVEMRLARERTQVMKVFTELSNSDTTKEDT